MAEDDGEMQDDREYTGHVLMIDDEEFVRKYVCAALPKIDRKCTAFSNGKEGIEYYRTHYSEIDMVIVDMIMPGMRGLTVFREIKTINPEARVVVASGYAVDDDLDQCMQEGATQFLHKPFLLEDLFEIVKKHTQSGG